MQTTQATPNHPNPNAEQGGMSQPVQTAGTKPVKAGVVAPSEDELRKARDVINRAKQTGVKLQPGSGGGQARIMLPNGESRAEYIKRRWKDGVDRTTILNEIKSAGGDHENCTYQVVFAATKGVEGGPGGTKSNGEKKSYTLAPKPSATAAE